MTRSTQSGGGLCSNILGHQTRYWPLSIRLTKSCGLASVWMMVNSRNSLLSTRYWGAAARTSAVTTSTQYIFAAPMHTVQRRSAEHPVIPQDLNDPDDGVRVNTAPLCNGQEGQMGYTVRRRFRQRLKVHGKPCRDDIRNVHSFRSTRKYDVGRQVDIVTHLTPNRVPQASPFVIETGHHRRSRYRAHC